MHRPSRAHELDRRDRPSNRDRICLSDFDHQFPTDGSSWVYSGQVKWTKVNQRFRKSYSQIVKFELYNRREFLEGIRKNNGIHREYTSPNRSGSEFDDQSWCSIDHWNYSRSGTHLIIIKIQKARRRAPLQITWRGKISFSKPNCPLPHPAFPSINFTFPPAPSSFSYLFDHRTFRSQSLFAAGT